jgi:hypothetical protein
MYQHTRTIAALIGLAVLALAAIPAHAGVATGTLSLSIRIVDSCDVHTSLLGSGEQDAAPTITVQVPRSHSTCSAGVPAPKVMTTVIPPQQAMDGGHTKEIKGRGPAKIVTIYF